jgi:glycosyltransferase involved in cell wall biosynthesis
VLECTIFAGHFDGDSPLLVLGDMPLRCRGQQTVFVQQSNLLRQEKIKWQPWMIKYALARLIFRLNIERAQAFIVQTDVMRDSLVSSYPSLVGRVHVIAQPVPSWLMRSEIRRHGRISSNSSGLDLIYPAARYPHKNHKLLAKIDSEACCPVSRLTLTINAIDNPAPHLAWVECRGLLSSQAMVEAYSRVDALLFLSKEESYGFPLVEAMFVGLPIICPNLPYARTLCGDKAIYFNPDEPDSLQSAFKELQSRLNSGWWPDWQDRVNKMPVSWEAVASQMLEIACERRVFQA